MAGAAEDQTGLHGLGKPLCLHANLLLFLLGEIDKVIVLGTDKERDSRLVETSSLPIPLLDGIEGALAGQIEHEEDGDSIVADEGQHVDKLALTAKIPDGEGDFRVSDAYGLFHEVDTCKSDCQRSYRIRVYLSTYPRSEYSPHPSFLRHI